MISWQQFPIFVFAAFGFWAVWGVTEYLAWRATRKNRLAPWLFWAGVLSIASFVVLLWISLQRPPLRTLGETRLWYALLLPLSGAAVQYRWKTRWLSYYCVLMSAMFLMIGLRSPDSYDKTLMPALQSFWFIPHVIVYMVGYALLGASWLVGVHGLYLDVRRKETSTGFLLGNRLVVLGFVFLSLGLIFGAVWAKEAWGHYWTWDPKETWALLTWLVYLMYLHFFHAGRKSHRLAFILLISAFAILMMCWFGLNALPTSQTSVHTYTS